MVQPEAYLLVWADHMEVDSPTAWAKIADISAVAPVIRTVGFIVKETKQAYYVSHTADAEECSNPFIILRSTVISKKKLKLPAPSRKDSGTETA